MFTRYTCLAAGAPLLIWYTSCGQRRVTAILADMDVDELQHAPGAIVLEAAYLELIQERR